jgi:hypothetical protein
MTGCDCHLSDLKQPFDQENAAEAIVSASIQNPNHVVYELGK